MHMEYVCQEQKSIFFHYNRNMGMKCSIGLFILLSFPITVIHTSIYLVMKYTTMIVKAFQSDKV
jgi:glycerol-3-phosphate acyltransferase PlsY